MSDTFAVTKCDIVDIITEGHRFLIHIFFVTIITNLIDNNGVDIITSSLVKTLLATTLAIILYHVLVKRMIEPKLKMLKKICDEN